MKLEQLIVQHLYNSKKVTIQDIGTFTIAPDVVLPSENEKDVVLPEGAISFEYNGRAVQDESLIEFVMQQTRKIRPLAASDLESYSILSKQFLNLGKPLLIEGLGSLQKNQAGSYEFRQGQFASARLEAVAPRAKEKDPEQISFRSTQNRMTRNNSKKIWFVLLAIFAVVLAGGSIFYLLKKTNKKKEDITIVSTDTVPPKPTITAIPDTSSKPLTADTLKPVITSGDSVTFSIIMKYRSKAVAEKAQTYLRSFGHTLVLAPLDSVRYKLSMPIKALLSDTSKVKDSVSLMFGAKTFIELP